MKSITKYALIDSFGTAFYIIIIASLFYFLEHGGLNPEDTILAPISMLLLFVFSAAITAFLVLGKPIMLYIEGRKREAVSLLGYTLGILFLLTILAFILLFVFN